MLQGKFDLVIFASDGVVKNRVALGSDGASVAEVRAATGTALFFTRRRQSS